MRTGSIWRSTYIVVLVLGCLDACSASRSSLPGVTAQTNSIDRVRMQSVGSVAGDVVAIDAGGGGAGGFAADQGFTGNKTWTSVTTKTIDTSSIDAPGPQAVYQSMRVGLSSFTYTVSGLTPGAIYSLQLSFAETYWTAAGKRVFNVTANGAPLLTNFDIVAAAGAPNKAITRTADVTAAANGTIAIGFTSIVDHAAISAIEIRASGAAAPTPGPGGGIAIDAGGSASGNYVADEDFTARDTWTSVTTNPIATSAVANPAPQAVYQTQRLGSPITYTIPGLVAGAPYSVRLDFAELFFKSSGQRLFNVSINGTSALTNFDIFKAAGGANTALAETFPAKANSAGTIVIAFTAVTNYPAINGIQIVPGGSSTPTPTPAPVGFNDYVTFGYDNAHDIYNPNSTRITPASIPKLHLAWQISMGDQHTQTQPVLATGIAGHSGLLFAGGASGRVVAYDALTGSLVWKTSLGHEIIGGCGSGAVAGTGGTVAYDPASKSLYVVEHAKGNVIDLYHLDAASGTVLGKVNAAAPVAAAGESEIGHTAVTLRGSIAYLGVGSTCDVSPWRGEAVAVNVPAMTVASRYFTLWDPTGARGQGAQPWSGGSIWGWGGVTLDANGNVLTGVGNGDSGGNGALPAPFVHAPHEFSGLGDALVELNPAISTALASDHPTAAGAFGGIAHDLDVQGTPILFTPNGTGCVPMVATQAKAGTLSLYTEAGLSKGPVAQYYMAPSAWSDSYFGGPTYSPATGLLYADVEASTSPSLFPPGLIAINPGCGRPSVTWHAAFGTAGLPRSVPAASAGGVVVAGTEASTSSGGDVWAVDATNGTVLNGGAPILKTSGFIRMPATMDGDWVFVLDNNGNMYGLTIDASVPAIQPRGLSTTDEHPWNPGTHD